MATRAKFKVASITEHEGGFKEVKLSAVQGDTPENKGFWEATPSGSIALGIYNPEASAQFQAGQEFYLDFSAVE